MMPIKSKDIQQGFRLLPVVTAILILWMGIIIYQFHNQAATGDSLSRVNALLIKSKDQPYYNELKKYTATRYKNGKISDRDYQTILHKYETLALQQTLNGSPIALPSSELINPNPHSDLKTQAKLIKNFGDI